MLEYVKYALLVATLVVTVLFQLSLYGPLRNASRPQFRVMSGLLSLFLSVTLLTFQFQMRHDSHWTYQQSGMNVVYVLMLLGGLLLIGMAANYRRKTDVSMWYGLSSIVPIMSLLMVEVPYWSVGTVLI